MGADDCKSRRKVTAGHRVLFVGNSDSEALAEAYKSLVEADGCTGGPIMIGHWTRFSWTLVDHFENAQEPNSHLHRLVAPGKHNWDVVVFQDQSQIPTFSRDRSIDWEQTKLAA
eukprot:3595221-Prymnesium_polylepis.1